MTAGGDRDAQRQRAGAAAAAEAVCLHGEEPPGRLRQAVGRHAAAALFFCIPPSSCCCVSVRLLRLLAALLGGRIHRALLRRRYLHRCGIAQLWEAASSALMCICGLSLSGMHGAGLANCALGRRGMTLVEFQMQHAFGFDSFMKIGQGCARYVCIGRVYLYMCKCDQSWSCLPICFLRYICMNVCTYVCSYVYVSMLVTNTMSLVSDVFRLRSAHDGRPPRVRGRQDSGQGARSGRRVGSDRGSDRNHRAHRPAGIPFRLLHIIPQSISSSRSCLSPCPVCVSAALPGIEHRARRRDKERERGPGYRCDGIGIL